MGRRSRETGTSAKWLIVLLASIFVVGTSSALAEVDRSLGARLDKNTFSACGRARSNASAPSKNDAKNLARNFKALQSKKAKKTIADALSEASSKKERRAAFKKAVAWCRTEDAYRTVNLTVPPRIDVTDATGTTLTGTATPNATIKAQSASVVAAADGSFSLEITGLVAGDNRVSVRASADLYYPTTRSVVISQTESEFAFKASAGPISYDELVKDPDALVGRRIYSRAQVFQYDSRTGTDGLLVSVTQEQPGQFEFWTDQVLLALTDSSLGDGIDNDDIIEFWGTVTGSFDYETAVGGTNSVPAVLVQYMTLIEKRTE